MPRTTLYNINADGGAWVSIPCTIPAHLCEIVEDGSAPDGAQGLQAQFPADSYGTTDTYTGGQPIELSGNGNDGVLGYPAQGTEGAFNYRGADVYAKIRSATSSTTIVRVTESETGVAA